MPEGTKAQPWKAVWPPSGSISSGTEGHKAGHKLPGGKNAAFGYNDKDEGVAKDEDVTTEKK